MHKAEKYYSLLSSVWSTWVLVFVMSFEYLPLFEDEDVNIDKIIKGNYKIPEVVNTDSEALIKHTMNIDPSSKQDIEQIKKDLQYNLDKPSNNYLELIIEYLGIPIDERNFKCMRSLWI